MIENPRGRTYPHFTILSGIVTGRLFGRPGEAKMKTIG